MMPSGSESSLPILLSWMIYRLHPAKATGRPRHRFATSLAAWTGKDETKGAGLERQEST